MNGVFNSNAANVPAVSATATNQAEAIEAISDGTAISASGARVAVNAGTTNGVAVAAIALGQGIGVRSTSDSGWAINAQSKTGVGILGASDDNVGVEGICQNGFNYGVMGKGPNAGVAAFNPNNNHAAYLASDCCAGWFTGNVHISGNVFKGGGGFRIDHPLDPETKFLSHSFVESPEMKNLYDGIVILNKKGEGLVRLPKWFEAVNKDFRYQLTAIGSAAPGIYISQEVQNGEFIIAGGKSGQKISWQVTGVRHDPWAETNRIEVEKSKSKDERGHYFHPEIHGAPAEKGIGFKRHNQKKTEPKKK